ncbi:MAG TPA: IclR family transcriptional regulator [Rhizomicrobium sp.]|nr:IclR family transcriptional regulator [Rhizomicrobium sp.]
MGLIERTAPHEEPGLASVDLVISLVELLASSKRSHAMSDIARQMGISKARTHRHLRALMQHGYVLQDRATERYEIGTKLLALGEAVRDRFDVLAAARTEMSKLRDETGQTVTVSTLIENAVVVLELLRGKTVVEFGVRPGSTLDFHASAHGLVALAFGPSHLAEQVLARPLKAWTPSTPTDPAKLKKLIDKVRAQRWATAADQFLVGVNALAVPVFDYRDAWCGTIAIVGPTQFICATPSKEQLRQVSAAAAEASRRLGWRTP